MTVKKILKVERAEYSERIVHALSAQLQQEYGRGFTKRNLFNMIRLAQVFPQEEILHRITEIAPPDKDADTATLLGAIQSELVSVTNFEREFPSICFALATGAGNTR